MGLVLGEGVEEGGGKGRRQIEKEDGMEERRKEELERETSWGGTS